MLDFALVDHGGRQDVAPAHNGLLYIKDGDGRARLGHLQVHLKEVPQIGNVLQRVKARCERHQKDVIPEARDCEQRRQKAF